MRLIDADELKEIILESPDDIVDITLIFDLIDDQPTVNGWIPCSERLPLKEIAKEKEERGSGAVYPCLIRIKNNKTRFPNFAYFVERDGETYFCEEHLEKFNDVIAWMPLPEPYKGE